MKDRLIYIADALQKLQDNLWVRSDGETIFMGAKNELADVIATYSEPQAPAPVVEYKALTGDDLAALKGDIATEVRAQVASDLDSAKQGIVAAIGAESEQSDVTVLAAIAATRTDVLAAVAPAPQA
jgi:hypothetical protein